MDDTKGTPKEIEFRAFFKLGAYLHCPRCFVFGQIQNFIVNGCPDGFVLLTGACASCHDIVQVYAAGESYHELPPVEQRKGG